MKIFRKRVSYVFGSIIFAAIHCYATLIIFFNIASQNILIATIWNVGIVAFSLLLEKLEQHFLYKIRDKYKEDEMPVLIRILHSYLSGASVKISLYLFYLFAVICSSIIAAEPDFPFLGYFSDYLASVQYGILILVAADNYLKHLFEGMSAKSSKGEL